MNDLLHCILVSNCDNSEERFRLAQKVRKSDEWLKLSREVARVAVDVGTNLPIEGGTEKRLDNEFLPHQATTLTFTPHMPLSNPLTAVDRGEYANIYIQCFAMAIPGTSIYLTSGTICALGHQTLYNVFCEKLTKLATQYEIVATYHASTAEIIAGIGGRFFVGSIFTPAKGGGPTIGNGDGGTLWSPMEPHIAHKSLGEPKIEMTPGAVEERPDKGTTQVGAGRLAGSRASLLETAEERALARKLENPSAYPTLSVKEAATAFGKAQSTIYRWVETGKLVSTGAAGRIQTESVKRLLNTPKSED